MILLVDVNNEHELISEKQYFMTDDCFHSPAFFPCSKYAQVSHAVCGSMIRKIVLSYNND